MNWKKTLLACTLILLAGVGIMTMIFSTEPTAQREGATRKTAMLVEVTHGEQGAFRPTIQAMGTVQPQQDVMLAPRVSGELVERAPVFEPGGHVSAGEMLVRIDPADYRIALQQRQSELQQALADLNVEMGRQDVARQDYQLFEEELPDEKKALVLRRPQLKIAEAEVAAARAAVQQAELDVQRTIVKAPFNAHILSREVDVGSQVAAGQTLGRLVGLDTYWIVTTIPLTKLPMVAFPQAGKAQGATARVYNPAVWPAGSWRDGRVVSLVGSLEEQTRMARVLVAVSDPLAIRPESTGKPPLMIDAYVEVHIDARELHDVVRLDRDYVRKDDTVWINADGDLQIRDVNIVFRDARYAYIDQGLTAADQVVTTNLRTVTEGVGLRLKGSGDTAEEDPSSAAENVEKSGDGR